jgi:hypothetical protein
MLIRAAILSPACCWVLCNLFFIAWHCFEYIVENLVCLFSCSCSVYLDSHISFSLLRRNSKGLLRGCSGVAQGLLVTPQANGLSSVLANSCKAQQEWDNQSRIQPDSGTQVLLASTRVSRITTYSTYGLGFGRGNHGFAVRRRLANRGASAGPGRNHRATTPGRCCLVRNETRPLGVSASGPPMRNSSISMSRSSRCSYLTGC